MPTKDQQSTSSNKIDASECPYSWDLLYSDDECEVKLITWPPGVYSCAHDHGNSKGVVRVLSGKIYQKIFDKNTQKLIEEQDLSAGDSFFETPDMIHIMGNSGKEEATTLHIYTPRLTMKKYDLN